MTKVAEKREARAATAAAAVEAQAARGVGRPSEYEPEFCAAVIEAGREGKGKAEIAAVLDVSRETLDEWAKRHAEFSDALKRAKDLSLAWWESEARTNLKTQGFQAALWGKSVSGRFPDEPYRERHELSGPGGGPVQTQPLADELAALPKEKRDALRAAIKSSLGEV